MLQERILKTLDKRDSLDQRKLAKIAGVNESSISRYLNGFESLNLPAVLKIVQFLFPEEEKEVMAEYVLTQKSRNARFALEYCDLNSMSDEVHKLIEPLSVSVNPVDKEWATLYRLMRMMKEKKLPLEKLLLQVEVFDPKEIEMKIMKQIFKGYIYGRLGDFTSQMFHTKYTEIMIKEVKSEFLKDCFNIRLGLIKNYTFLYNNDLEKARYFSHLVLKQNYFKNIKGIAYHHLGHSYLFENYSESKRYLNLAIALFHETNQEDHCVIAMRKLDLLEIHWKQSFPLSFEMNTVADHINYIYYLIQNGKIDSAKDLLGQIKQDTLSLQDKGYYYYFLGIVSGNKTLFYDSVNYFRSAGDLFHVSLPVEKLRILGENEVILRIFTS